MDGKLSAQLMMQHAWRYVSDLCHP